VFIDVWPLNCRTFTEQLAIAPFGIGCMHQTRIPFEGNAYRSAIVELNGELTFGRIYPDSARVAFKY
jgi:hypothetical protein